MVFFRKKNFFFNFRGGEVPSKNRLLAYSIPRVYFIGNTADCKKCEKIPSMNFRVAKDQNNVIDTVSA